MGEWDYLKEKTNDELLHMYLEEKKIEVKQELTMRYLYIVKSIAVQMRNTYAGSLQMEDIINEGVIAIMKGLERYDPAMNIKFETFISRRIRGMIIDLMRQNDWMPRDFRKNSRAIEEARVSLMSTLGREPTEEELAQAVQTDVKKFRKIQSMSSIMNVLSLDMIQDDDTNQSIQLADKAPGSQPEAVFIKGETRQMLVEAINSLKEKEKLVVSLCYVEELNMGQIAQVMAVSEPRVSQLHSAAIRKLKQYMSKYM